MRLMTDGGTPPPLQMTVQTRFQQNYRIASAVNAGSDTIAIRNGRGAVELFTVGSDNTVWNFYPDPASDTGYSGVSTGLASGTMGAGVDANGNIVLFTSQGTQLQYVVESPNGTTRWGQPAPIDVPQMPGSQRIAALFTREIAGQLYVAALTAVKGVIGTTYNLAWSQWDTSAPIFNRTSLVFSSTNCVWLGQNAATAAFACVDQTIVSYSIANGTTTNFPMAAPFTSLSVDVAGDATGNDRIVAVLADANAYVLTGGANGQPYSWTQIAQNLSFRQIAAESEADGTISIFAVSGNNRVYHWATETSSITGYSFPPMPIATGTATIAVAADDAGSIDVFAVGTTHNTLSHIFLEETSTGWTVEALEVAANGQVEEYISYSTDVTLFDDQGALLVETPVVVSSSEETRVTINGATYFIEASKPAKVSTNAAGILSIGQEAGSLAIPDLQLFVPAVMAPNESVALAQSTVTQEPLAAVTGPELMTATLPTGDFLLGNEYRTKETTDSLASALTQCMALPVAPAAAPSLLTRHSQSAGAWFRSRGSAHELPRRIAPAVEQHWQLSFDGRRVTYRDLAPGEAAALLAFKRASLPDAADLFDFIDDIGDVLESVVDGVANVIDTVVTTVADGVQAAITFVIDGVTAIYNVVVDTVEQAFALVEMILAQVKVIFELIFLWLGFLFDWQNYIRTHDAIVYAVNQLLAFLQGAAGGMQQVLDRGIGNVQSQLASLFDNAVKNIAGTASLGSFEQSHAGGPSVMSSATSNTIIAGAVLDNAGGSTATSAALLAALDTSPFDALVQQLEQFATNTEAGDAFRKAATYFQNLGGSIDQIFTQLLAGMMQVVQGVLQAALAGVQAIVDAVLQLAQSVIAAVQAALNESWNIPFVSQLYEFITGSELTTLSLIALLIAIPTNIVYAIAHGSVPFPDGSSVESFEGAFSAQSMLSASGLGPKTAAADVAATGAASSAPQFTAFLAAAASVSTLFYGLFSAVNDALADEAPDFLEKAAYILSLSGQIFSCPWISGSTAPDCTTADGTAATLWIYGGFGCLLDGVFLATEVPHDAEVVVGFVSACGQLIVSIIASIPAEATAVASNILSCVPPLSKLALLKSIITATGGVSPLVVGGIDGLFYTTVAILGVATPPESDVLAEALLVTA